MTRLAAVGIALACALFAFAGDANAKPRKGYRTHVHHAYIHKPRVKKHLYRFSQRRVYRVRVRPAQYQPAQQNAYQQPSFEPFEAIGQAGSSLVSIARQYIGAGARQLGLPSSLWCSDFANMVARKAGMHGSGSRVAKSWLSAGTRVSRPVPGAIAVFNRRGGGHVGIVSAVRPDGRAVVISGNGRGNRVHESVYSRSAIAYIIPRG